MKINLKNISTEIVHGNTVFRKRLITPGENERKLATCNYAWIKKGKQLEIHSHPDGEEYYLFLDGNGEMLIGDKWIIVKKDDFIAVPSGKNHSVKNDNSKDLIFITIRTIDD